VCALLVAAFYNELTVSNYRLETDKLTAPVRIALLADLHSFYYGDKQETLIAEINRQNPDMVLMTGDIASDGIPHNGTIDLLAGIAHKYPCFYVSGNHELWSGEIDVIKDIFRSYDVCVLEGECETVEVAGQQVNICGVDDPDIGGEEFFLQLRDASAAADTSLYTILLAHRPEWFEQMAAYSWDLVLSGHAHGGQVRFPVLLNGLFAPNQGYFPKYTSGIYALAGTKMLVSRGLFPTLENLPRIFNPPELVMIDLAPMPKN
jgi:predicted MPP superfamily phosphohydrolase